MLPHLGRGSIGLMVKIQAKTRLRGAMTSLSS